MSGMQMSEDAILAMPFDRARSLLAYWDRCPPTNESIAMLLAAQTTWKPPAKPKPFRESTPEDFAAFAQAMGVPLQRSKKG